MKGRYEHVLSFALTHPWSVLPEMLSVIAGILAHRMAGVDIDQAAIDAALVNRKNLPQPRAGSVAIIPVYGVLGPRMNMFSQMSGGTTYEQLTSQLREAVGNDAIKSIVFDIDSPGGSVAGNAEFHAEVLQARTRKPITAVAQYTMGSAAYHLGSAATKIVAAPSAQVGGIGTFTIHEDLSEALAKLGVKRTYISAGEGKVDGNPTGPPSDDYLARTKSMVDGAFNQFVANVVKGRGTGMTAERVTKDWKAHVYGAAEALQIGMIDEIATLDATIARLLSGSPDATDQRAALTYSSIGHTPQEPATVTGQDGSSNPYSQTNEFDRELVECEQLAL